MASKLNPYLQFKDNAREAMTFTKTSSAATWSSTPSASTAVTATA